nr:hypothetical protein [Olegusella massiliensis]
MIFKRFVAILVSISMVAALAGCGSKNTDSEDTTSNDTTASQTSGNTTQSKSNVPEFDSLNDPALLQYIEDDVYADLENELGTADYEIENVTAIYVPYVSDEYKEELAYNSKSNIYFGYTLAELDEQFQGTRYIFTTDDNGNTTVREFQAYDDTYDQVVRNVATGTGVILVCVTVTVVTGGVGAAPVCTVFAAAAKTGTITALSGGVISGVAAGAVKAYETGGDMDAVLKEAAIKGSEGFMWGAITGALNGGVSEFAALRNASSASEAAAATDGATTSPKEIPAWRKAELAVLKKFGGSDQVSYLAGKEVPRGTPGSTRPDVVTKIKGEDVALEVKRYDLENNLPKLYESLKKEIADRIANLPEGFKQEIILNVEGRGYSEAIIENAKEGIWSALQDIYPNIPIEIMG